MVTDQKVMNTNLYYFCNVFGRFASVFARIANGMLISRRDTNFEANDSSRATQLDTTVNLSERRAGLHTEPNDSIPCISP